MVGEGILHSVLALRRTPNQWQILIKQGGKVSEVFAALKNAGAEARQQGTGLLGKIEGLHYIRAGGNLTRTQRGG